MFNGGSGLQGGKGSGHSYMAAAGRGCINKGRGGSHGPQRHGRHTQASGVAGVGAVDLSACGSALVVALEAAHMRQTFLLVHACHATAHFRQLLSQAGKTRPDDKIMSKAG